MFAYYLKHILKYILRGRIEYLIYDTIINFHITEENIKNVENYILKYQKLKRKY